MLHSFGHLVSASNDPMTGFRVRERPGDATHPPSLPLSVPSPLLQAQMTTQMASQRTSTTLVASGFDSSASVTGAGRGTAGGGETPPTTWVARTAE